MSFGQFKSSGRVSIKTVKGVGGVPTFTEDAGRGEKGAKEMKLL